MCITSPLAPRNPYMSQKCDPVPGCALGCVGWLCTAHQEWPLLRWEPSFHPHTAALWAVCVHPVSPSCSPSSALISWQEEKMPWLVAGSLCCHFLATASHPKGECCVPQPIPELQSDIHGLCWAFLHVNPAEFHGKRVGGRRTRQTKCPVPHLANASSLALLHCLVRLCMLQNWLNKNPTRWGQKWPGSMLTLCKHSPTDSVLADPEVARSILMLTLPAEAEPAAPAPRVSLGPISVARLSLLAKGDRATCAQSGNLHTGAKPRWREGSCLIICKSM